MSAPSSATATVEVHHEIPRCLLQLRERAEAAGFTGEGIELALEYEHKARRWGVDPDLSRDELAALVEGSTVELPAGKHRNGHAEDFRRWGRRGSLSGSMLCLRRSTLSRPPGLGGSPASGRPPAACEG